MHPRWPRLGPTLIVLLLGLVTFAGCFERPRAEEGTWRTDVDSDGVAGIRFASGEDLVVLGWRLESAGQPPSKLTALDATDGRRLWQVASDVPYPTRAAVLADPPRILFMGDRDHGSKYSIHAGDSGATLVQGEADAWHDYRGDLRFFRLSATSGLPTSYVLTSAGPDGVEHWRRTFTDPAYIRLDWMVLAPMGTDLVLVEEKFRHHLWVFDAATGSPRWNHSINATAGAQLLQIHMPISFDVAARQMVVAAVEACDHCGANGTRTKRPIVFGFDLDDGTQLWQKTLQGQDETEVKALAAIGGLHVALLDPGQGPNCRVPPCSARYIALDGASGAERWRFEDAPGPLGIERVVRLEAEQDSAKVLLLSLASPAFGPEKTGDSHWHVRRLSASNGSIQDEWTIPIPGPVLFADLTRDGDTAFTAVYYFDLSSSRKGWTIRPISLVDP